MSKLKSRVFQHTGTVLAFVLLGPQHALAQREEAPASRGSPSIEEVLVTARKVTESLQSTPVAVTALTEQQIETSYAQNLRGLTNIAPNVVVSHFFNTPYAAAISIRGIGTQDPDGFIDPGVGVVVDGVYQGRAATALVDLGNVEQIEVLRGPQPTLFGANTIGGVVNIRTKKPSGELGGRASVTVGNHGRRDVNGSIDFPIIEDQLAGKIAYVSRNSDGFMRNAANGKRIGGDDMDIVRGYLSYIGSDSLTVDFSFEHMKDSTLLTVVPLSVPNRSGRTYSENGVPIIQRMALIGFPGFDPGNLPRDMLTASVGDPSFGEPFTDVKATGATLNIEWEMSPSTTLTAITGYREITEDSIEDQDGYVDFILTTHHYRESWQFSQELRSHTRFSDRFDVTAGLYYFQQKNLLDQNFALDAYLAGVPGFTSIGQFLVELPTIYEQMDHSYNIFADANYYVTDKLRLNAGIRYTHQKKDFDLLSDNLGRQTLDNVEKWDLWGGRIGLDYQFTPDFMAYANFARGFKSGGFNGRAASIFAIGPFDEETVNAYEAGFKSDLLNNRLRLNFAAFLNDYKDLQVDQLLDVALPGGGTSQETVIANAASARIYGAEVELLAVPAPGLTLRGELGYMHNEYRDFQVDLNFDGIQDDATHLKLKNVPKWSMRFNVDYEVPETPLGFFTLHGQIAHTSTRESNTNNRFTGTVGPLTLLDASIDWTTDPDAAWRLSVWGRNLTDKRYISTGFEVGSLWSSGAYGEPRTYGVSATARF